MKKMSDSELKAKEGGKNVAGHQGNATGRVAKASVRNGRVYVNSQPFTGNSTAGTYRNGYKVANVTKPNANKNSNKKTK